MATDFSAIGEKIKAGMVAEERGIPAPTVTSNIKETTIQAKPPDSAKAPAGQKPAEKPDAPKVLKVKVDGVEKEVPEDKIIEMGTKYYGLDGHFTRKGQELAQKEKELQVMAEQIRSREANIEENIKKVLSQRDTERYEQERRIQEEKEFQDLELNDPVQAKFIKANKQLQKEIDGLKTSFSTELEDLKKFREMTVQERQTERNEQLLGKLADAAQQHHVEEDEIIGYMAKHPDEYDPYAVAQKVFERNEAKIEEAVRKRLAGNSGTTRVASARANTPIVTPTGEKPPNMFKDRQGAVKYLVNILENAENPG